MGAIKENVAKIKNNPIGAVVGGVAFFYGAKKFAKVENKWALGAIAVVGVVVGALVQSKIRAKSGAPTAQTVTTTTTTPKK